MANPSYTNVHVSQPLTDLSVAYFQANLGKYAAVRAFPVVGVQKMSNSFYTYNRGDLLRTEAKYRAPGTPVAKGGYRTSTDTYLCDRAAFGKNIDDPTRNNADPQFDLEGEAVDYITDQVLRKMDKDFLTDFFTTGIWDGASSSTDMTGSATAPASTTEDFLQWNDVASTPIEDIHGEMDAVESGSGYRPNTLVLGPRVRTSLINHPDIIDRIKYTQKGIVDDALLAALFGVEQVITLRAVENSGAEGAAESIDFMAGKHALLLYRPAQAGLRTPSAGYTFTWTGGGPAGGVQIKRYRDEPIESDVLEGETWYDSKRVASDLAAFFASAVA